MLQVFFAYDFTFLNIFILLIGSETLFRSLSPPDLPECTQIFRTKYITGGSFFVYFIIICFKQKHSQTALFKFSHHLGYKLYSTKAVFS